MVNNWKLICAVLVIFAAGVVTGGLLVHHVQPRKGAVGGRAAAPLPERMQVSPGELPRLNERELQITLERRRMDFLLGATRELQLTPEQRERVEQVIRDSHERTRKLWEQVGPPMRREIVEVRERISAELTPRQRLRFEQLMKRPQGQGQGPPFALPRRGEEGPLAPEGRGREFRRPLGPREGQGPGGQPRLNQPAANPPGSNPPAAPPPEKQ